MAEKNKKSIEKFGKFMLAILEHFVKEKIGEDAVDILREKYSEHETIITALVHTQARFIGEHDDTDLSEAIPDLPLADLPSIQQAVNDFLNRPTSIVLPTILETRLSVDYPSISSERIEKAVSKFLEILSEELIIEDEEFRQKDQALTTRGIKNDTTSMTSSLEELVAQGKVASTPASTARQVLHQLRPPVADFTGREAQLKELRQAVTKGGATITGMRGMGGIGKTELALKLGDQLKNDYPDAQIMLDLRGAHQQEPLTTAAAIQHVILAFEPGMQLPESVEQLRPIYYSVLHGKSALLLMDNASDRAQVEALIPPTGCLLLVTSRQHFTLPGMQSVDLQRMDQQDAIELLLKIAPRIGEQAKVISKLCDYLPLALRLAGSALAENPDLLVEDYLTQLADASTRLGLVEASLRLSYDLLDEQLQEQWRALAVFPESFDKTAATAVWHLDEEQAQAALSAVLRFSLLEFNPEMNRYRLHDMGRDYANSQLEKEERHEFELRHSRHYLSVLRSSDDLFKQGNEQLPSGLALYDLEEVNIHKGQAWAVAHATEDKRAAELTNAYPDAGAYILDLRLHARERIQWLEDALGAARELDDKPAQGVHLGNLGLAYAVLGEVRRAIEFHEQALVISRELGDRGGEGQDLGNLGLAYADLGEVRRAIEYYEQQLEIVKEIGDRRGESNALGNLGIAYRNLGEVRRAIEYYEQQLEIVKEIGDRRGEGNALGNLGVAYAALGEVRQAIEYYEQHLEITQEIGDRRGEGNALNGLGNAYSDLEEMQRAIEYYEQQLEIVKEIGNRRGEGQALGNLGVAYKNLGEVRRAIEYYEQQLEIVKEIGDRRGESTALWNMARAKKELGELAEAIRLAEASLVIKEEIEDPFADTVRQRLEAWRNEAG